MFFDQVKLSHNGFHARLQKYVLGTIPFETNFCPYFWITMFCLIVCPLVFIGTALA